METPELSRILEAKGPRLPSPAFLERLSAWLAVFSEHYQQEITKLSVFAYELALRDLTVAELELGCMKALEKCKFMPRAAEIRRLTKVPSKNCDFYIPEHKEEQRGCSLCQKTGWKMVDHPGGTGKWATLCDCRKKSKAVTVP